MSHLATNLIVHHGNINVGILVRDDRALFLDFGDGEAADYVGNKRISPDWALLTHHHREQAAGLRRYQYVKVGVPEKEKAFFTSVDRVRQAPHSHYHRYDFQPYLHLPRHPVAVDRVLREGEEFLWQDCSIRAVATPGHTPGSMSYIVESEGKVYAFVGDLIHGNGQIHDIWSLQLGNEYFRDYHGFMGALPLLKRSLDRLAALNPDVVIPSHGSIIYNPGQAFAKLQRLLNEVFTNYATISSARFYFPEAFRGWDVSGVKFGAARCSLPDWVVEAPVSRLICNPDGQVFVIDCGNERVLEVLEDMRKSGKMKEVAGVYITHYHDDHVDRVNDLVERYGCPVYATEQLTDILERPPAYNMPCQSEKPVQVTHPLRHGEKFEWGVYRLTNYFFPGQTLYHGALLVEGRGCRILFAGDSFTPGGIDDYCAYNRNFLGPDQGLRLCTGIIREVMPDMIANQHVEGAFVFEKSDLDFVESMLEKREALLRNLLPWDNPNFGLDPYWVRFLPYEQHIPAGGIGKTAVVVRNHSYRPLEVEVEFHVPDEWRCDTRKKKLVVPAKSEGTAVFYLKTGQAGGLKVIGASVRVGRYRFSEIAESHLTVEGSS